MNLFNSIRYLAILAAFVFSSAFKSTPLRNPLLAKSLFPQSSKTALGLTTADFKNGMTFEVGK